MLNLINYKNLKTLLPFDLMLIHVIVKRFSDILSNKNEKNKNKNK